MKLLIVLFAGICAFTACSDNNSKNTDEAVSQSDTSSAKTSAGKTNCYFYTNNKDTITLQLTIIDHSVSGVLEYRFSEKDMNQGVLQGEMRGDTLLADYEFKSEGIVSVREVAFLKKGDAFAEGFGEAEEKDGKMMFKNVAGLTYSDTELLKKLNCPK